MSRDSLLLRKGVRLALAVGLPLVPFALPAADTGYALTPVKRHPNAGADAYVSAQIQIARLRQTADQLRLLHSQPKSGEVAAGARDERARHEAWLRQAESRVATLAEQWEARLRPLAGTSPLRPEEYDRLLDLNSFFQSQSVTLQSKLQRESVTGEFAGEPVRAVNETARVVIGNMNGLR